MNRVGMQLGIWAMGRDSSKERDLFGRSAYNRFYYAAFLVTRKMLSDFNPEWKKQSHSAIPCLLTGQVKKEPIAALKRQNRARVISPSASRKMESQLRDATSDLAALLQEAYQVRRIADYEPEISVTLQNGTMSLSGHKFGTACGWSNRASHLCGIIRRIWEDSGCLTT